MKRRSLYFSVLFSALLHGLVFGLLLLISIFDLKPELLDGRRPIQVRVLGPGDSEGPLLKTGFLSGLTSRKIPEAPTLLHQVARAGEEGKNFPVLSPLTEASPKPSLPAPVIVSLDAKTTEEVRTPPIPPSLAEGLPREAPLKPVPVVPPAVQSPKEVLPPSAPLQAPSSPELARVAPKAQEEDQRNLPPPELQAIPSETPPPAEAKPPQSLSDLSTEGILDKYATEKGDASREKPDLQAKVASEGEAPREDISLDTPDPLFQTYFAEIRLKIQRELHYPPEAESENIRGQSLVRFVLVASGDVAELRVLDPSGHPILDKASLEAIRRAKPFGPFPPDILAKWRQLPIRAKFRFGQ